MKTDPRVEGKAELITYHVQTNEGIHLSDKSRHDIFHQVRDVAAFWKAECDDMREANHAKRWNELKLFIKRNKGSQINIEDMLDIMSMLDNKEYIRDIRIENKLEKDVDSNLKRIVY